MSYSEKIIIMNNNSLALFSLLSNKIIFLFIQEKNRKENFSKSI
jgi:hypothetical protein